MNWAKHYFTLVHNNDIFSFSGLVSQKMETATP